MVLTKSVTHSADRANSYVAIKISISERRNDQHNQEYRVMKTLASLKQNSHLMEMLDEFDVEGPNGKHKCLVLELLGPCIPDVIESRYSDGRLPGHLAKTIAEQSLRGLKILHEQGIAHGDLHVRNLAVVLPFPIDDMSEEVFIDMLGKPKVGLVQKVSGQPVEPGMPQHIVQSATYSKIPLKPFRGIKIVDFGQSFLPAFAPRTLRTPLAVRPPEVLFSDPLDFRVDLWSMGCMLFELFVGQPPFDGPPSTPEVLVEQMRETAGHELPERWRGLIKEGSETNTAGSSLQSWLEETYFDNERKSDLTREDIRVLGGLIAKLLYFEPSRRAPASEILSDGWFRAGDA
ncbi:protein kinase-like protein [Metarhizium anisopliae]